MTDSFDDRREAWIETFERAFDHVPLVFYDEDRKPAERALGELIALAERLDRIRALLTKPNGVITNEWYYRVQSEALQIARDE